MTLNHKNADYLIDNEVFSYLNISVDGSTKEIIENVRKNVKYEMLCDNMKYFFSRIDKTRPFFHNISFSFFLMTDNYRDLPTFLDFLLRCRDSSTIKFSIQIHGLAPLDFAGQSYRSFVEDHHHTKIDRLELIAA